MVPLFLLVFVVVVASTTTGPLRFVIESDAQQMKSSPPPHRHRHRQFNAASFGDGDAPAPDYYYYYYPHGPHHQRNPMAPAASPAAVIINRDYVHLLPSHHNYYGDDTSYWGGKINHNNYWKDSSAPSSFGINQQKLETSFAADAVAAPKIGETSRTKLDARAFGTLTLTLGSTWSTYTVTTTTTCTTSTTNIKVCSPSKGRRRRGNIIGLHRLVFDEEEAEDELEEIFAAPRKAADDQKMTT